MEGFFLVYFLFFIDFIEDPRPSFCWEVLLRESIIKKKGVWVRQAACEKEWVKESGYEGWFY